MKKICGALVLILLILCSACTVEPEVSEQPSESAEVSEVSEISEASEATDPLATQEWEQVSTSGKDTVVRKYRKEFHDSVDEYTVSVEVYTNDVLTEKGITVFSKGYKTYTEQYEYDGDTLVRCDKETRFPGTNEEICHSYSYLFSEDYHYERDFDLREDGAIISGTSKDFADDGAVIRTEEYSRKEIDGFDCSYIICNEFENGILTAIYHEARDSDFEIYYLEKYSVKNVLLYTLKDVDDVITVSFPDVGAYTKADKEYEFFDAGGKIFCKAVLEGNNFNIYELFNEYTIDEAIAKATEVFNAAQNNGAMY